MRFDAANCKLIDVQRWDAPLTHLPDEDALRLYLAGRGLSESVMHEAVNRISTPLHLTKRGALIFAQKVADF